MVQLRKSAAQAKKKKAEEEYNIFNKTQRIDSDFDKASDRTISVVCGRYCGRLRSFLWSFAVVCSRYKSF